MDVTKIEDKLDKVVAGNTIVDMSLGGVRFQTMMELFEFSKLMAISGAAIPNAFRGNPGTCLAICTRAMRFGFDPFALAEHAFVMAKSTKIDGRWQDVETVAFDSAVIRAVINSHAPIKGRIRYAYEGEGDNLVCIASAVTLDGETITHKSKTLIERKSSIKTNDGGVLKGSPLWESKPVVQLSYDTGRDLCRIHFPEVLLGWHDKDDFSPASQVETKDVTPKPRISSRLKGQKGKGFNQEHIEQHTGSAEPPTADGKAEEVNSGLEPAASDASSAEPQEIEPADAWDEGAKAADDGKMFEDCPAYSEPLIDAWRAGFEARKEA